MHLISFVHCTVSHIILDLTKKVAKWLTLSACKDLSHKHLVSTKKNFVQIFDCGPAHKKQHIFKVVVNGQYFQPTIASDNKKKAKADANNPL